MFRQRSGTAARYIDPDTRSMDGNGGRREAGGYGGLSSTSGSGLAEGRVMAEPEVMPRNRRLGPTGGAARGPGLALPRGGLGWPYRTLAYAWCSPRPCTSAR